MRGTKAIEFVSVTNNASNGSGTTFFYGLGPVSAKNHPAPGVALAVLLTTFPAFRPELRFFEKCRGKKLGSEIALGKTPLAKKSL
jgi:hypothetical protein